MALVHAAIARQVHGFGQPSAPPCVLISGGETTVTVRGTGRGGRNAEFLLALGVALDGHPGIYAFAGDTDGIDGTEDNAGALLGPDSLARAASAGVSAKAMLSNNDGYSFFSAIGDLGGHRPNPHQCERFPRHFGPSLRQILLWTIPDLIILARTRKGCCYAAYSRCETRFQFSISWSMKTDILGAATTVALEPMVLLRV